MPEPTRNCYAHARSFLFRTIKLAVANEQQLVEHVRKWQTVLAREHGFAHVRRFILCWYEDEAGQGRQSPYLSLEPCERRDVDAEGLQTCADPRDFCSPGLSDEIVVHQQHWQVVAGFLRQLTGLVDLMYAWPGPFPPWLLETLHDHLPRCRLHHFAFDWEVDSHDAVDEIAVATSPSLIRVGRYSLSHPNRRLAWEFVRRRASGLKGGHIYLENAFRSKGTEEDNTGGMSRLGLDPSHPIRPLQFLELDQLFFVTGVPIYLGKFVRLFRAALGDFCALRVLKINMPMVSLDSLPAPREFPALVTLVFTCTTAPRDMTPPTYWRDLLGFLRHLPKLTTLRLKNWNRLKSVVPGLSPNLRVLELATLATLDGVGLGALRDDHIHQLAQLCPLIEDLAVEIQRSRGDAAEVSRYRAIGRLPRLQRLRIRLGASPPMPFALRSGAGGSGGGSGSGSTVDIEQQSTTIEPWFNSPINAALARSIWTVIQDSKRSTPLSGAAVLRPLERLELCAIRGMCPPRDWMSLPRAVLLQ